MLDWGDNTEKERCDALAGRWRWNGGTRLTNPDIKRFEWISIFFSNSWMTISQNGLDGTWNWNLNAVLFKCIDALLLQLVLVWCCHEIHEKPAALFSLLYDYSSTTLHHISTSSVIFPLFKIQKISFDQIGAGGISYLRLRH